MVNLDLYGASPFFSVNGNGHATIKQEAKPKTNDFDRGYAAGLAAARQIGARASPATPSTPSPPAPKVKSTKAKRTTYENGIGPNWMDRYIDPNTGRKYKWGYKPSKYLSTQNWSPPMVKMPADGLCHCAACEAKRKSATGE